MLKNLLEWHRNWEDMHIRLLEDPSSVQSLPHGWQRRLLEGTEVMSEIERRQLLDFALKYRGWRIYLWIAAGIVVCSLMGLIAHRFMPGKSLVNIVLATNVLGLATLVTFVVAWFNYRKFANKPFRSGLSMVALGALGVLTGTAVAGMGSERSLVEQLQAQPVALYGGLLAVAVCFLVSITWISLWRNKEYEALTATMQLEAERDRSARLQSESQLRLLRAQIEPHFLFNTLGAVQQLAEQGAPRAAELTSNLIAFLRASLDGMRRERIRLDEDFQMVEAYLQVMQVRMGTRLRYRLALPAEFHAEEVPSMMLLTLVENAIKHGLEPALRGGEVLISAARADGGLRLQVRDSGVGLAAQPGNGDGLANIRARLQLAYGSGASLALTEAEDGGVQADILLPL